MGCPRDPLRCSWLTVTGAALQAAPRAWGLGSTEGLGCGWGPRPWPRPPSPWFLSMAQKSHAPGAYRLPLRGFPANTRRPRQKPGPKLVPLRVSRGGLGPPGSQRGVTILPEIPAGAKGCTNTCQWFPGGPVLAGSSPHPGASQSPSTGPRLCPPAWDFSPYLQS